LIPSGVECSLEIDDQVNQLGIEELKPEPDATARPFGLFFAEEMW
jgi:hypothetical protein